MTSPRNLFRRAAAALFLAILLIALPACQTEEITGRKQFILIGESTEIEMGLEAYKQFLAKAPVSKDARVNDMVTRVGKRIAQASGRSDYKWEFTVIDDPKTVNAFALPGGKVAIYTGILPVTQDEAGLATVMGHEVAHATAHHGAERMTTSAAIQLVLAGGETALSLALEKKDPGTVDAVMKAFGIGATAGSTLLVEYPFDRKQESAADQIGLTYMARAGYDPAQAIEFWKRMSQLDRGGAPPQFLSTHPSHEVRVENLKKWLPGAKAEYEKSPLKGK